MAKLCNTSGFFVQLRDVMFPMLVGNDIYVDYTSLVDSFPILKERESKLEKASKEVKGELRGRHANLANGTSYPIDCTKSYVTMKSFIRELLYVRYKGKETELVADLISSMIKSPVAGMLQSLKEANELKKINLSSTETKTTKKSNTPSSGVNEDDDLAPESAQAFRNLLHGKVYKRVYFPENVPRDILTMFGVFVEKSSWHHANSSNYPVCCMKFQHGYILTRSRWGVVETDVYLSNDQIKSTLRGIGYKNASLSEYLNEHFGGKSLYNYLYSRSAEEHIYTEMSPERGNDASRVGLIRADVISSVFSNFNDDTSVCLCSALDSMRSYVFSNRKFFEDFMGIEEINDYAEKEKVEIKKKQTYR